MVDAPTSNAAPIGAAAEDRVFAALASRARRRILDMLRPGPMTTGDIAARFKKLSRFAVMQHLRVLARARLVLPVRTGRECLNHLNPVPIHQTLSRWARPEDAPFVSMLGAIKQAAEESARP